MVYYDMSQVLYARLRAGFPSGFDLQQAYNLVQASITQGKLQSSDAEKVKARASFLVSVGSVPSCCVVIAFCYGHKLYNMAIHLHAEGHTFQFGWGFFLCVFVLFLF
jgi:hypothetical protein